MFLCFSDFSLINSTIWTIGQLTSEIRQKSVAQENKPTSCKHWSAGKKREKQLIWACRWVYSFLSYRLTFSTLDEFSYTTHTHTHTVTLRFGSKEKKKDKTNKFITKTKKRRQSEKVLINDWHNQVTFDRSALLLSTWPSFRHYSKV